MSYDNPNRIKYSFGIFDFGGASGETFSIKGPKGKAGRLWDYGVEGVVEVMNGDAVHPQIAVGTPSDADAYGEELDLQAVADNDAKSVRSTYHESASGFTALMVNPDIPADQEVVVTCTAATTNPTGQGVPFAIIDWQN